jgi:hypothetical protein
VLETVPFFTQELLKAKHAIVSCGDFEMELEQFQSVYVTARILVERLEATTLPELPLLLLNDSNLITASQADPITALYGHMRLFAGTRCQDPLDNMYALLSLQDPPAVVADYSLSPCELWSNLYRFFIARGHIARLLCKAAYQIQRSGTSENSTSDPWRRDSSLPSWLLDFSTTWRLDYLSVDPREAGINVEPH